MIDGDVFINGSWVTRSAAQISVFDRGFIFGDGIYEVIPIYNRKHFLANEHLGRLDRSAKSIGINNPYNQAQWMEIVEKAITTIDSEKQKVYIQLTRGVAPRAHSFPDNITPTVVVFSDPLTEQTEVQAQAGTAVITLPDIRWLRGDIKSISLLGAVLASEAAKAAGATEAILIRDEMVSEGASSNVLLAVDGGLISPSINNLVLTGITMLHIKKLCNEGGISFSEQPVSEQQLRDASEIMISSATREVMAVTNLDGKSVGDGNCGKLCSRLSELYRDSITEFLAS